MSDGPTTPPGDDPTTPGDNARPGGDDPRPADEIPEASEVGTPEPTPADPVARREDGTPLDEAGGVLAARVEPVVIEDEMRSSYLDYAMSVIVGRALPDARDGLKPVHRRILHSMDETGLRPDRPYRKCASAVGDVMKKYHPHGDSSIYDALVRMGQDFSIRYPLIDGHGNFGSVDGDPAAAMRYTESRLSRLAMELLRDIDEDTVDFVPNYDGYENEPVVLPARFPNLLVNGSSGIAVGMATNIPPHNLGEVIDATIALIDDPTLTAVDLMQYVPAPDFPTGGLILGNQGAYDAYTTGKGSIRVRAVCTIEEPEKGRDRERIVVTEIPYMVNKANLLQKIAQLVNAKVITGIADLRDESSREGMRMVIDLKRDANAQVVLNQLFKHTQLQDSFGANVLALVDGVPRTITLDQALSYYISHQVDVITRRTRYRLRKAEDRAHVLEGLLIALDHIDEIIALIRGSASADAAKAELQTRFELSEIQAQAILDMQLRRLAALERQRIQDEYDDLQRLIAELREILADPSRIRAIIKDELTEVRDKFADERRSRIVPDEGAMTVEDLIPVSDVAITLSRAGYIKRTPVDAFRTQKRGGRGVRGAEMKEDDIVASLLTCSTHDHLLFFTNRGRVYRIKAYQVPEKSRSSKGVYVANVPGLALEQGETVAAVRALNDFTGERYLVFATKQGTVKRTRLDAFDSPRSVLIAINLADDDELIGVAVTDGDQDVVLVSRKGYAIRFGEDDARAMGRTAAGVRGMRLKGADDEVLAMGVVGTQDADDDTYLLVVTDRGFGKRTPMVNYPTQKRGGQGVQTVKLTESRGGLAGSLVVPYEAEVLLVSDTGVIIRMNLADVRPMSRATQGVSLMKPGDGASVVAVALVVDDEDGADPDGDESPE
ncbi:MAG TPA: DNA gyrase subunit A [Egicoccus sp.]|nr:DNA gyrase subunit A [Egicoccus sp.]HSK24337.1 DNA gyrase subunit A [Egicoccus sp.]